MKRLMALFLCLLLSACALQPKVLRAKLDECDKYHFDSLVYRRSRDGAVVKVLCVPVQAEIDNQYNVPMIIPQVLKRLVPMFKD